MSQLSRIIRDGGRPFPGEKIVLPDLSGYYKHPRWEKAFIPPQSWINNDVAPHLRHLVNIAVHSAHHDVFSLGSITISGRKVRQHTGSPFYGVWGCLASFRYYHAGDLVTNPDHTVSSGPAFLERPIKVLVDPSG